MKIIEAINEVDNLNPNMYGTQEKIKWLSRLDTRIFQEVLLTHELRDEEKAQFDTDEEGNLVFNGYGEDDANTELLVGEPYDEMYVNWLTAQIDWANMEYDGFNHANAMFTVDFENFCNAFNRTHTPKGTSLIYY